MPTSRKVLCGVYAGIALVALVATWRQNLTYVGKAEFLGTFVADTKVTAASRSLTVDLLLLGLAVVILMVLEARRHGIRFVWAYVLAGMLVAISVAFPLFLLARELRLADSDTPRPDRLDTVLLTGFAAAVLAMTVWIEIG